MRPLLEALTEKNSTSYWAQEICCNKSYLYDKNMTELLMMLPHVVQAYWLHQPIQNDHFIPVLDFLQFYDEFLVTHAPFSPEMEKLMMERNAVVFFLIRDPRDWVISVIKHPPLSGIDIYGGPIGDRHFANLSFKEKISAIIKGSHRYYSAEEVWNRFIGWKDSPVCCTLRFEALLGPRGGMYSEKEQLAELRKIAQALHLDITDEQLLEAFSSSFGKGIVFSKGKAGAWKEHFEEEHKAQFKELMGDLLIELGYEHNDEW